MNPGIRESRKASPGVPSVTDRPSLEFGGEIPVTDPELSMIPESTFQFRPPSTATPPVKVPLQTPAVTVSLAVVAPPLTDSSWATRATA